jgi:hypothetical protein
MCTFWTRRGQEVGEEWGSDTVCNRVMFGVRGCRRLEDSRGVPVHTRQQRCAIIEAGECSRSEHSKGVHVDGPEWWSAHDAPESVDRRKKVQQVGAEQRSEPVHTR